jgi:adenine C2-methylase RlmN of 23S rRNA A2503 and tRNA A37
LGVEEVFIGFDKEFYQHNSDKANEYADKLLKLAQKFTPYCKTYVLWDEWDLLDYKDSPVDKGKNVLEILMKRKHEIRTRKEVV